MDIVLVILVFQSFVLAASLLFSKKETKPGAAWIGAYFMISGIYFVGLYAYRQYGSPSFDFFQGFALLVAPLINPIFFIAWRKINGYKELESRQLLLHLLPFLCILLLMSFVFLIKGQEYAPICVFLSELSPGIKILFNAQWIVYLALLFQNLLRSPDLKWTEQRWKINAGGVLLGSYVLGYFLHSVELYNYYSSTISGNMPFLFPFHSNLLILFTFITTNFLLFKSLDRERIAFHAVSQIVAYGEGWNDRQRDFDQIEQAIENDRLFTNADLTLSLVAKRTGIKERIISATINSITNKGFNEYINELRVTEAKKLLTSSDKSIKEIQHLVGFKSKTTFFDSFKRMTAKTPKEFRELKA